jgi:hypothetical protein
MLRQDHLCNIALLTGAQGTLIFEPDANMLTESLALVLGAQGASSLAEVLMWCSPPIWTAC